MSAATDETIKTTFIASLENSVRRTEPYRHWLLEDCLPEETARAVIALPFDPPTIGDTEGKRATNNDSRLHFGPSYQKDHPIIAQLARVFQDGETVAAIERASGTSITGDSLRIEYCQDIDGFWLEPHTDIGVKTFTMLIYLSEGEGSQGWGTDIYADDAERTHLGASPAGFNKALIFIPGNNTWHGFEKRPINGVRRSLIVNYVTQEWRNRHELCYPDQPVVAQMPPGE